MVETEVKSGKIVINFKFKYMKKHKFLYAIRVFYYCLFIFIVLTSSYEFLLETTM